MAELLDGALDETSGFIVFSKVIFHLNAEFGVADSVFEGQSGERYTSVRLSIHKCADLCCEMLAAMFDRTEADCNWAANLARTFARQNANAARDFARSFRSAQSLRPVARNRRPQRAREAERQERLGHPLDVWRRQNHGVCSKRLPAETCY